MDVRKLTDPKDWLESERVIETAFLHPWDETEARERIQTQANGSLPRPEVSWGLFDGDTMLTSISTLQHQLLFGGEVINAGEFHMVGSLPERRGGGGVRRLFGEIVPPFSSTKAFTGHATSAAGGIELVISLLALQHGFIPANLHFQQAMENGMTPVCQTEQKALRNVLCNSFGFGGNDSSLLIAKEGQDLSAALEDNTYTVLADVIATEEADYKRYISPMQARRLSPMLRQLVFAAYSALEVAQGVVPDAIITGTDLGCIAYSVSLLNQLTEEGEDALSPTLFMQSTHNTPSSLIAILTRNHGYNCTWSHGAHSYEQALRDAQTQIQLGLIRSALVLGFEENDDTWQALETAANIHHTPQARATLIVNIKSPLSNVK